MNEPYWNLVRQLVESGQEQNRPKHEISAAIARRVYEAIDTDEPWAGEVVARWAQGGAAKDYTEVFKDMNLVTYIRKDGRRTRKTTAYSRPMRASDDGAIVGRQMQAWWGMSRAMIFELRADLAGQDERLRETVEMLDLIGAAMDRHPECATAAEAWEADGHDLGEIDLAGVA